LKVRVCVRDDVSGWRDGEHIYSKHCITLGEALEGCRIRVETVGGEESLQIGDQAIQSQHRFPGKGVQGTKGDHVAVIKVWTPKHLDAATISFARRLADIEPQ
jgi:DnaJ-class molecular chaperone